MKQVIINGIEMNKFEKTLSGKSILMDYVTPEIKVAVFQTEGVLCSSGTTEQFKEQDYSDGSFWN